MAISDLKTAAAGFLADPAFGLGTAVVGQAPTPAGGSAPPAVNFNGIFEENVGEPLQLAGFAERKERRAVVECPTLISNAWPGYTTGWTFTINGEVWFFDGFEGRDVDLAAIRLVMPGQAKIAHGR